MSVIPYLPSPSSTSYRHHFWKVCNHKKYGQLLQDWQRGRAMGDKIVRERIRRGGRAWEGWARSRTSQCNCPWPRRAFGGPVTAHSNGRYAYSWAGGMLGVMTSVMSKSCAPYKPVAICWQLFPLLLPALRIASLFMKMIITFLFRIHNYDFKYSSKIYSENLWYNPIVWFMIYISVIINVKKTISIFYKI